MKPDTVRASGFTELLEFGNGRDLVFKPNFNVGEVCPFVNPYTPLLKIMYSMSTFRLPALTKWPAPIPNPSPSPPTVAIGFLLRIQTSLRPVKKGAPYRGACVSHRC